MLSRLLLVAAFAVPSSLAHADVTTCVAGSNMVTCLDGQSQVTKVIAAPGDGRTAVIQQGKKRATRVHDDGFGTTHVQSDAETTTIHYSPTGDTYIQGSDGQESHCHASPVTNTTYCD
jgi:hypothetical protein